MILNMETQNPGRRNMTTDVIHVLEVKNPTTTREVPSHLR